MTSPAHGVHNTPKRDGAPELGALEVRWGRVFVALGFVVVIAIVVWATTREPREVPALAELKVDPQRFLGTELAVQGYVVPGSLAKRRKACEYRFQISDDHADLAIRYDACIVPDSLCDRPRGRLFVKARGWLSADGSWLDVRELYVNAAERGYVVPEERVTAGPCWTPIP